MVMDVWEHAYYIDYRNRRADSVKATGMSSTGKRSESGLGLRHNINIKEGERRLCAALLHVSCRCGERRGLSAVGDIVRLYGPGSRDDERQEKFLLPFLSFAVRPGL